MEVVAGDITVSVCFMQPTLAYIGGPRRYRETAALDSRLGAVSGCHITLIVSSEAFKVRLRDEPGHRKRLTTSAALYAEEAANTEDSSDPGCSTCRR